MNKKTRVTAQRHAFAAFILAALLTTSSVALSAAATGEFHAPEIPADARLPKNFRLTDANGKTRVLADWRGKVVALFFGYTQCPDACPTGLARAAQAVRLLGTAGKEVQVIFVTLDPMRDTPAVLREYPIAFHPDFLGLFAPPAQTPAVARAFRVFYRVNPGATPQTYTLDHGVQTYVYDKKGKPRLAISHAASAEEMAEDLRTLLAEKD
ncbi:MAG: SCO family protein [Zoogloeaceae bacterium]|nr:SCO family protein [Zoogloeaceae bacterium]